MNLVREMLAAEIAKPNQSARGLAIRAGLGPDAVRDILREKSQVAKVDTLMALAKALGGDITMFATADATAPAPPAGEMERSVAFAGDPPQFNAWAKDTPVLGTASGGGMTIDGVVVEQTVLETFDVVDMVRRPPSQRGNAKLYALYVVGSSMEPRHEPGDLVYVDPRRAPMIGDDVVVQLRDGNGHDGDERIVTALIKRLVRRTADGVELEQYNPRMKFIIDKKHIAALHRVVRITELATV